MRGTLDQALVQQLSKKRASECGDIERLSAAKRNIEEIKSLAFMPRLRRLDLSGNQISSWGGITDCTSLHWLSVSSNQITELQTLSNLTELQVLNVSSNKLWGKLKLPDLPSLGALIACDNAITGLKGLKAATALNTLVLKNNQMSSLSSFLHGCSALVKLSLAHNKLQDLSSSLNGCLALAELRLSHNQLTQLPPDLARNSQLRILELGGNPIERLDSVKVLEKLPQLRSLTLKGCPLTKLDDYQLSTRKLLPQLPILDGNKTAELSRHLSSNTAAAARECADPAGNRRAIAESAEQTSEAEPAADPVMSIKKQKRKRRMTDTSELQEVQEGTSDAEKAGPLEKKAKKRKEKKRKTKEIEGNRAAIAAGDASCDASQQRKSAASSSPPQNDMTAKKKKNGRKWRAVEVPAFLNDLISGRLEPDMRGEQSPDEGLEEITLSSSHQVGQEKSRDGDKAIAVKPGMHGAKVAEALQLGLLGADLGDIGLGGPSTWQ